MADSNESKNKNSGPNKAKRKGKSAILEIFDWNLRKLQCLASDSSTSLKVRKESKTMILVPNHWNQSKMQKTCRISAAFVIYLVFLNFDFGPVEFIFCKCLIKGATKLKCAFFPDFWRRIRIRDYYSILFNISAKYL